MLMCISQSYPIDTVKVAYQRDCLHMSEASKKGLVRQAIKYRSMDSFIGKNFSFPSVNSDT
jgi:hypothetical protein